MEAALLHVNGDTGSGLCHACAVKSRGYDVMPALAFAPFPTCYYSDRSGSEDRFPLK
ncbi:hypothetical protein FKM82_009984 [Ascaphus truei]